MRGVLGLISGRVRFEGVLFARTFFPPPKMWGTFITDVDVRIDDGPECVQVKPQS